MNAAGDGHELNVNREFIAVNLSMPTCVEVHNEISDHLSQNKTVQMLSTQV